MKDFSQNGEQKIILDYFGDFVGTFCDIGANDGVTLSNTRALALNGWQGVLVEPSPKAFELLERNYKGRGLSGVSCFNHAIGTQTDKMTLHESNSHIVNGDNNNLALLSTLVPSEMNRWKGTQEFTPVEVDCFTWEDSGLSEFCFEMISIDAEGLDYEILSQIDLSYTKLICIEWNGIQEIKKKVIDYCLDFGLTLSYENGENLILTR